MTFVCLTVCFLLSTSETDEHLCPVRMRHSPYCYVTVYVCSLAAEVQCPRLVYRAEVGVCPAAFTAAVQWYGWVFMFLGAKFQKINKTVQLIGRNVIILKHTEIRLL